MNCTKCGRDSKYVPNGTLTDVDDRLICDDCLGRTTKPVNETTTFSDRPADETPLKEAVDTELRG